MDNTVTNRNRMDAELVNDTAAMLQNIARALKSAVPLNPNDVRVPRIIENAQETLAIVAARLTAIRAGLEVR